MNKSDMIRKLAKKHKLPVTVVKKIVDDMFVTIMDEVLSGDTVMVSGFGKFFLKEYNDKRRLDPRTGTVVTLRGGMSPVFEASVDFKKSARKGGDVHEDES